MNYLVTPTFYFRPADAVGSTSDVFDLSESEDETQPPVSVSTTTKQQPAKRTQKGRKAIAIVSSESEDDYASPETDGSSDEAPTKRKGAKSGPSRKKTSSVPSGENASASESPEVIVGAKKRVVKAQKGAEKAPQLKVQKLRISPFHKKSGPMPNVTELADAGPKFGDGNDHSPSAADVEDAPARRPVRANRSKATYFQPHVLSSDSEPGNQSESEESSEYEE